MGLRFLIVEGNERDVREAHGRTVGETMGQRYAKVLAAIVPGVDCDIHLVADAGAKLPGQPLATYHAAFFTGSHLQLSKNDGAALRQVEFARSVIEAGVPTFGSCWGMQVTVAAAGGRIVADPDGGEVAVARNICPTPAGTGHPMLADRPGAFDALSLHADVVSDLPPGAAVLARNAAAIQAVAFGPGQRCWGVQYHPELNLPHVAAGLERQAGTLVRKGFFRDQSDARAFLDDVRALGRQPERRDLAWRYGISSEILDETRRRSELKRFIDHCVRPAAADASL